MSMSMIWKARDFELLRRRGRRVIGNMKLEVFALCDSAADYAGRLTVMGVFEGIASAEKPIYRDRCCVALRMRFSSAEEGNHEVMIKFMGPDGKSAMPDMKAGFPVKLPPGRISGAINLVLSISKLKIEDFGDHEVIFFLDGQPHASVPLAVAQEARRAGPDSEN